MRFISSIKSSILSVKLILQDYVHLELKKKTELTEQEKKLIKELRENMRVPRESIPGKRWKRFARKLRFYIKWFDPRNFLRWEVITSTMFLNNIQKECLDELKKTHEWENVWSRLIQGDSFGNPKRDISFPETTGTSVAHAYHLMELKKNTNIDFSKLSIIVEFGAGYGNMCRLLRKIGFAGVYIIYDLPEFLEVQRYFLKNVGIRVVSGEEYCGEGGTVVLVDNEKLLNKIYQKIADKENGLFIATWSISESPIKLRNTIFELVKGLKYFLFGYQIKFDDFDNVEYFKKLKEDNKNIYWTEKYIDFWNGYYLFGKK